MYIHLWIIFRKDALFSSGKAIFPSSKPNCANVSIRSNGKISLSGFQASYKHTQTFLLTVHTLLKLLYFVLINTYVFYICITE